MRHLHAFCLAAIAALTASAAQAVTINWNTDVPWGDVKWRQITPNATGYRDVSHIDPNGGKAAYRLNVRFSDSLPSAGTLVMLGGLLAESYAVRDAGLTLALDGTGTLKATLRDMSGTHTLSGSGNLVQGLNQIVLAIEREYVDERYHAVVSVFVNGKEAFTFDGDLGGVTFDRITVGRGHAVTDDPLDVAKPPIICSPPPPRPMGSRGSTRSATPTRPCSSPSPPRSRSWPLAPPASPFAARPPEPSPSEAHP